MANDTFNLFVSIFVSFSINGLKENAENLNYYPILRRKVELYLFLQHWSCDKIAKSQNSDKATSFSSVVVNIASSVQKVSYSKPLHNQSRCLNTMKSFLTFKVISTWIFLYFQKVLTMKLKQNTQFTTAILSCFIFTA